jgi:methyl-accepting chemotaxis protein
MIISSAIWRILGHRRGHERIVKGNMSAEIPGFGRRDEVGAMAEALSVFRNGMQEAETMRREREAQKVKAEEDQRRAMHALADDFERSVNGVVQSVARSAEEMKQQP